jgi:glutathione peroxidase
MTESIFDFELTTIDGAPLAMSGFKGHPLLVINTASACGFTPQFEGLEALHRRFGPQGLVVLGFPCNQFGRQDPGSNAEIGAFCQRNYGVSFPMMSRVDVRGAHAAPVFRWLTMQAPGLLGTRAIKWNFTKFLVSGDGRAVQRFAPRTSPEQLVPAIEEQLKR